MAQHVFQKSNPILGRGNYHAKVGNDGKQQKFKLVEGMRIDSSLPQVPSILATRSDLRGDSSRFTTTASEFGSEITMKDESIFAPANVGRVLRFFAFFEEIVDESPSELFRLRKSMILFYLTDNTIEIIENKVTNSGIPQGTFLKRGKLFKPQGGHYTMNDIYVGMHFPIYGRVFKLYSCDAWTRQYYLDQGNELQQDIDIPRDEYSMTRDEISKLCGGDMGHFYENCRKVLNFKCEYDDREKLYGDLMHYSLNYFLEDDTIEIKEIQKANSGRDPFPLLLSRCRLQKVWEEAIQDEQARGVEEPTGREAYFNEEDLYVGAVVNVFSRPVKLVDADDYTRKYYREIWSLELGPPMYLDEPAKELKKADPPPYTGYGTEEDSLGSVTHLVPKVPKKDFKKMSENDRKVLRYSARMISGRREQSARQFIIAFYLADDTISIYEPEQRNSGIVSGKFLERGPHKKPDGTRYRLEDFAIGNDVKEFVLSGNVSVRTTIERTTTMDESAGAVSGGISLQQEHVANPLHQIRHLTKHMSKAVALNVDTTMRNRSKSSISHAQRSNSDASSDGNEVSSSDHSTSEDSSENNSPTALIFTMPLPPVEERHHSPGLAKAKTTPKKIVAGEALLMPGKAFLESFYLFLKQHAKSLRVRNPRLQVLLNPPCLHYLEGCFNAMLLPSSNPETGTILQWQARKDLNDTKDDPRQVHQGMSKTNRMLKLAGYVLHIIDVSIQALPDTMPLPSACNLSIFSSLLYLKVDGVELDDIHHLDSLRKQLIELSISHCTISKLSDILGDKTSWHALKVLRLVGCHLQKLDPSLAQAPQLHTLAVAENELQTLSHLENCSHLATVDVSKNRLTSVAGAHRYLTNVTSLDLSYNQLPSTSGLEKMLSLHVLDLSHNVLATTGEVAFLVSLPLLESLVLEGNPFFDIPYRGRVLELLGKDIVLDNTPWSAEELSEADRFSHPTIDVLHDASLADNELYETTSPFYDLTSRILAFMRTLVQDVVGRALVLCCLLVVAHGLAQVIWPRDAMSDSRDNYMIWTVGSIAATILALALPVYGITWWVHRRPRSHSSPVPATLLSPRLTKQLSFNNQTGTYETEIPAASLDVLSTSLEVLVEWSKEMPLHDFISMASEVTKLLGFLGQMGSFAKKTWIHDEAILHRVWAEHRHDSDISIQELVKDDLEKDDPQSLTRTLLRMIPVLMFLRNLCLEMEKDNEVSLQHCVSSAYAHTIAKQCKHAWLVQKAIISAIQLAPTTREELLHMWDVEDLEQDLEFKEQRLHACGRMFDIVVVHLAKLRDVYNIREN